MYLISSVSLIKLGILIAKPSKPSGLIADSNTLSVTRHTKEGGGGVLWGKMTKLCFTLFVFHWHSLRLMIHATFVQSFFLFLM